MLHIFPSLQVFSVNKDQLFPSDPPFISLLTKGVDPGDVALLQIYFVGNNIDLFFSRVCFSQFWSKKSQIGNFLIESQRFGDFGVGRAKIWLFSFRKCHLIALLM